MLECVNTPVEFLCQPTAAKEL